jgi:hypothetical protein
MKTFYSIVPSSDGYHYIGLDEQGNHILLSKMKSLDTGLIFKDAETAQEYIETHLNPKDYITEQVMLSESYYKNLPE